MKTRNIIVGFDPGTTVGIAVISLKGELLGLYSKKFAKKSEIFDFILKYGRPIIISTDKSYIPKSVEQIASQFGCRVYHPKRELKIEEKNKLTKDFDSKIKNDHERDALASAMKAWKKFRSEIESTYNFLTRIGVEKKELEESFWIFFVKRRLRKKKENKKKLFVEERKNAEVVDLKTLDELKKEINFLRNSLLNAKKEANYYRRLLFELSKSITKKHLFDSGEYTKRLKKMNELLLEGFIPLIEVNDLSISNLEMLDKNIGLKNQAIITKDVEKLSNLNAFNIACVVLENKKVVDAERFNFPIVYLSDLEIKQIDGIKAVKREALNASIKRAKKWQIRKIIESYRKKR